MGKKEVLYVLEQLVWMAMIIVGGSALAYDLVLVNFYDSEPMSVEPLLLAILIIMFGAIMSRLAIIEKAIK